MASLILLGNINLATFANSIVAANAKAQELFDAPLDHIFAIHSDESFEEMSGSSQLTDREWITHLNAHGVDQNLITHRIIPISAEQSDIGPFVNYLELVVRGLDENSSLIVDLTNSTTLYKNILSVAAHILDLRHQYFLDIQILASLTDSRGYIGSEILSQTYFPAPIGAKFDDLGYLSLTDIVRYQHKIEQQTEKYLQIGGKNADGEFFRRNLQHSIRLKLRNDQQGADGSLYRIATSSALVSIDDLARLILSEHENAESLTFGQRLRRIEHLLAKSTPADFDVQLLHKLNDLILYLRNSTTHKTQFSDSLERYKAELATQLLFAFSDLYAEIVAPALNQAVEDGPVRMNLLEGPETSQSYYLGLDGDDTGLHVENEMLSAQSSDDVKRLSRRISGAIDAVCKQIRSSRCFSKNAIIVSAGDNVLFYGQPSLQLLKDLQHLYAVESDGLTCSIGYGKSLREVYLALKLAKTEPGKQGIVGIELVS